MHILWNKIIFKLYRKNDCIDKYYNVYEWWFFFSFVLVIIEIKLCQIYYYS